MSTGWPKNSDHEILLRGAKRAVALADCQHQLGLGPTIGRSLECASQERNSVYQFARMNVLHCQLAQVAIIQSHLGLLSIDNEQSIA